MKRIIQKSKIFFSVVTLVFASLPLGSATNVYAQATTKCDQAFYSSNDILFYNPCASQCSGSSAVTGDIASLRGKNNGEKIFNFWLDAGLTAQQAAGVTGSMQNEGGFNPFRQEISQSWPGGGWGIAQFTGGQRDSVTAFVKTAIGADLFNQYYKNDYGGAAVESNGFIPNGVPVGVNDKFLLGELNYLLQHVKELVPNDTRTSSLKRDFNQIIPASMTLYDYLKSLVQAGDSAIAWTYLYEFPGDIKNTSNARATSAADILKLYGEGIGTTCGGDLAEGGMTLEQGIKFMDNYKNNPDNVKYIGGAGQDCAGGPLANCVSFSIYFVNKYTTLKTKGSPGNGSTVVANLIGVNPDTKNGHSPRPYAIFSVPSGSQMCDGVKCGHTGVILGVDTAAGKVVVGEAGCGSGSSWTTAREYPLSQFDSDAYTYTYTDGLLKASVE